jgi:hypothetical protein
MRKTAAHGMVQRTRLNAMRARRSRDLGSRRESGECCAIRLRIFATAGLFFLIMSLTGHVHTSR